MILDVAAVLVTTVSLAEVVIARVVGVFLLDYRGVAIYDGAAATVAELAAGLDYDRGVLDIVIRGSELYDGGDLIDVLCSRDACE